MARIRTVKPEFWTNAQIMECAPLTRLFFIGLWNFCDDEGRHTLSLKQLKAQIFPADEIDSETIRRMIDELSQNDLITIYECDGKEYLQVTGWHHQKIDRKNSSKLPSPNSPTSIIKHSCGSINNSTNIRRNIDEQSPPERKGEERKGKDIKEKIKKEKTEPYLPFEEIIQRLNAKTGQKLNHKSEAHRKNISGRFSEGYTLEDFFTVIDKKCAEWMGGEYAKHLNPGTLFCKSHFDKYLNQPWPSKFKQLANQGKISEVSAHNLAVGQSWLEKRRSKADVE